MRTACVQRQPTGEWLRKVIVPRSNPPKEQTAVGAPRVQTGPANLSGTKDRGQPPGTVWRREFWPALHTNAYALSLEKAHVRRSNPVDHTAQRPAHRARRPDGALCRLLHARAVPCRAHGRAPPHAQCRRIVRCVAHGPVAPGGPGRRSCLRDPDAGGRDRPACGQAALRLADHRGRHHH